MNTTVSEKPTDQSGSSNPSSSSTLPGSEFSYASTEQKKSSRLSHRSLTIMLVLMCLTPIVTIAVLWMFLPPFGEGSLEANVYAEELPSADFYQVRFDERPAYDGGILVVENVGDLDWTHLINIRINGHYQIYDRETFPAHSVRRYKLNMFWNRTGARFSLRYNQLEKVTIFARRPNNGRATFHHVFPTVEESH